MKIAIEVPGSTSNLGPGFDCLGMALDALLHVEVEALPHRGLEIRVGGPHAHDLPTQSDNLVYATLLRVLRRRGVEPPGLRLRMQNAIPVARGLGSSGAAIVAGVVAGRLLCGEAALDRDELTAEAAAIEGHPDNVAASVHGGAVVAASVDGHVHSTRLPIPPDLRMLLLIPDHPVSTQEARAILPPQVALEDVVFNLARMGSLCAALALGDPHSLKMAMQDRLHSRHRLALVPGLAEALESLLQESGCRAATISGSGPTLIAFFDEYPAHAGRAAARLLQRHGVRSRIQSARPRAHGARWTHEPG
ncbi:MAG: homoserine kinase [Candidatus Latescibacterota bacterium]|nr:MAG: homoserine kinase [Candidatus Latescibacterota bacterium]